MYLATPFDPLNPNAASLYIEDIENFNKTVKLVMEKYNTLKKRGNKVTVLTGIPNYPDGKVYDSYLENKNKFNFYETTGLK